MMTQRIGLIGWPIKHSMSPLMQQAGFNSLGLDITYELWETEQGNLERMVETIRSPQVLGANVTAPFKQEVMGLLDGMNKTAEEIGAVNTIVKSGDKLIGYNTDAEGFLRALQEEGQFTPEGKRAVLIGAGGAARAVGFALAGAGIASLTICNRNQKRAAILASELKVQTSSVTGIEENGPFKEAVRASDLLVNCTPIGMMHGPAEGQSPIPEGFISSHTLVYDIIYNPVRTPLLLSAEKAGAKTLGGLSMLVFQGVASFELWTQKTAPVDIMMETVVKAL